MEERVKAVDCLIQVVSSTGFTVHQDHTADLIPSDLDELCHPQIQPQQSPQRVNLGSNNRLHQLFPKQALVFMCLQNKSFESTAGKGEIACYDQFLLFLTVFPTLLENFLSFS